MIRLSVNWHQMCRSCGTELVFDFMVGDSCCTCPWCGTEVSLQMQHPAPDAMERLSAAVQEFEERMNAELGA